MNKKMWVEILFVNGWMAFKFNLLIIYFFSLEKKKETKRIFNNFNFFITDID